MWGKIIKEKYILYGMSYIFREFLKISIDKWYLNPYNSYKYTVNKKLLSRVVEGLAR